ncbi:hypothetical protein E2R51_12380 [Jeotgalibacillus sp. S-D1]|uniref:hypothetical protein n=1 Tax=Jeotgalibacillus sp. S-D1 TaxID=2552189 RepID=UPI0010592724|nr:hypothetical protein [Jeotgalibacillus sp. S-D1]TDL32003.1 hypothetical protein E2R51_12380 [Jeotgalibacillus sp. S-D1]
MNKIMSAYLITIAGVGLLAVGLYFIKTIEDLQGMAGALPYICVGLGCGIFGHGMGEIILRHAMNHHSEAAKQLEIDKNDERNLAIANRAKGKAYDMMVFLFGALLLALGLMGLDLTMLLLIVFVYVFIVMYCTYYRFKYDKEM